MTVECIDMGIVVTPAAAIGLEECARFGDGDDVLNIVLEVVVITGEIDVVIADCDCGERETKGREIC